MRHTLVKWDAQGTQLRNVPLKRSISAEMEVHETGEICLT